MLLSKIFKNKLVPDITFDSYTTLPLDELSEKLNIPVSHLREKNNWVEINGEFYYFKSRNHKKILREFLGELASTYFGLPNVHNQIGEFTGWENPLIGIITKNFRTNGTLFKHPHEVFPGNGCFTSSYSFLESINEETLKKQMIFFIVREYLVSQEDRHSENFYFQCDENGTSIATILDNELSFNGTSKVYYNELFKFDLLYVVTQEAIKNCEYFQEALTLLMDFDSTKGFFVPLEERGLILTQDVKQDVRDHIDEKKDLILDLNLLKK